MSKTRHYPDDSKTLNRQILNAAGLDQLGAYHALMEERRQQVERHLVEAKASGLIPEISSTLLERLQSVSDRHDEKVRFLLRERTRYEYQALVAPPAIGKTRFGRPLSATGTRQMVIAHIRGIDRSLEKIVEKRNHTAEARPICMPRIRGGGNLPVESGVAGNTWVSKPAANTRSVHAERWQDAQRTCGQDNPE